MSKKQPVIVFIVFLLFALAVIFGLVFYLAKYKEMEKEISQTRTSYNEKLYRELSESARSGNLDPHISEKFTSPLSDASERVTKKPFGIYITPENSPLEGERFSGFHTGTDFEIFPFELDKEVSVNAICEGSLIATQTISGYGGVAIQNCILDSMQVTVLYGHLDPESIKFFPGDKIEKGEKMGELGDDKSSETDGERKHLHLGIIKGTQIDYRGYVQDEKELDLWIDPCLYACFK